MTNQPDMKTCSFFFRSRDLGPLLYFFINYAFMLV